MTGGFCVWLETSAPALPAKTAARTTIIPTTTKAAALRIVADICDLLFGRSAHKTAHDAGPFHVCDERDTSCSSRNSRYLNAYLHLLPGDAGQAPDSFDHLQPGAEEQKAAP